MSAANSEHFQYSFEMELVLEPVQFYYGIWTYKNKWKMSENPMESYFCFEFFEKKNNDEHSDREFNNVAYG